MQQLTLALDWTPNTNHIGFFIAREKGFYAEASLDVNIQDPSQDNYATTPAKKVELGRADFALCPIESIISYRTKKNPFPLIAVAAVLQDDLSAIACRRDSGIARPADLDGKRYASYQARYEDGIVKQMIRNDGGSGELTTDYPAKLGIWNTLLSGEFDATWVFLNWEAVQAGEEADLQYFKMADYGIPYSYSPVIAANEALLEEKRSAYTDFLAATKRGYRYAADHQREAADILGRFVPERDQNIDLQKSLALTAGSFGDDSTWGRMNEQNVAAFLTWLKEQGLERDAPAVSAIVTNALL
ncbi:ABC transporter substrate-binding protein [Neolewinella antarctica]|uniref:Thiamine pyrimidine synthase n=1 Tax=Neolewinella antarctica TaxID=442734 RepID=A0ABX0X9A1_9BACT|nr:ABC transporter substrate-binding protein [Neolewinella antarctica]NJC25811.1 ABC-type nitrate/sulfonate/bicarbonate transport system substrate-binding protein [Neolewinella antarctica]